jgi:glycosyltransferase involved in cell wall biosynthesis
MHMVTAGGRGLVSIILPTYNRAAFLPDAIASIRAQNYERWELIVVDDGSSDKTAELIPELCRDFADRLRYLRQQNQGAYAARNTGLQAATGEFIAFFDSDDLWLPHHLERCAVALNTHGDVDWVYGACRMVNFQTDEVIAPSTFYEHGQPRPFMRLRTIRRQALSVLDDPAMVTCAILKGLYCGLQNSVIRRSVFDRGLFDVDFHNESEDQVFAIRAAVAGHRFGYFDDVHVVYRVHESNSSASGVGQTPQKRLQISLELARGYEQLLINARLSPAEVRAVRQRLNREYFWHAGYVLLWQQHRREEALKMFSRGLRVWPWSASCWKTYLLALARSRVTPSQ